MEPRLWLPPAVGTDSLMMRGVRRCLETWLERWAALPPPVAVSEESATLERTAGGALPQEGRNVEPLPRSAIILGEIATGISPDAAWPADQEVLSSVGARMLDDLDRHLREVEAEQTIGAPSLELVQEQLTRLKIVIGEETVFHLRLDANLVHRFRVRGINPRTAPPGIRPLREALKPTELTLRCALGDTVLTAGEIAGLTPGDVLVLDTPHSASVSMVAGYTAIPLGHCNLIAENDLVSLQYVGPPDRGAPVKGAARK